MQQLKLILSGVVDASMAHVQRVVAPIAAAQERIGLRQSNLEKRLYKAQRGDPGPQGPKGDRGEIGPMPRHKWEGASLAFERPDGTFEEPIDLRGPPGPDGVARNAYGVPMAGSGDGVPGVYGGIGGGAAQAGSTFGYFPQGWA